MSSTHCSTSWSKGSLGECSRTVAALHCRFLHRLKTDALFAGMGKVSRPTCPDVEWKPSWGWLGVHAWSHVGGWLRWYKCLISECGLWKHYTLCPVATWVDHFFFCGMYQNWPSATKSIRLLKCLKWTCHARILSLYNPRRIQKVWRNCFAIWMLSARNIWAINSTKLGRPDNLPRVCTQIIYAI